MGPIIRIEGLTKEFQRGFRALEDVTLEVNRGEFVCVIGPSGSGKSTLLRCINRLLDPTSGRVFLDGVDLTQLRGRALRAARRRAGMIFQQFHLVRRSSVMKNVLNGRLGHQVGLNAWIPRFSRHDRELAWRCLDRLEIADKAPVRADRLSGGQQQRVAIARVLAQEPDLVLADEPVASLDPETAVVVMDYLRAINRDGITVVCSIHNLDLAKAYAHRIVAMRQGRIVYDGEPDALDAQAYRAIYGRLGYE